MARLLVLLTLLSAPIFGCSGDSEDGADADSDTDTDADSDGDTDTDSDTGVRWRVVYDEDELDGWVASAWGLAPDLVYFVGGTNDSSLLIVWNGETFERVDLDLGARLWWACGTAPNDVWVVGEGGVSAWYDGVEWTPAPAIEMNPVLWGCWPASRGDVWAVGERTPAMGEVDAVPRRVMRSTGSGAEWTLFEAPDGPPSNLFKMWGAAADDAWIVGENGTILHWNGLALENVDPGDLYRLVTVRGTATDEVYAVGGGSVMCQGGAFLAWDGEEWTVLKGGCDPYEADAWPALNGVSVDPEGTVFVAGIRGFIAQGRPGSMEVQEPLTDRDFHAVWAADVDDAWAVGGNMQTMAGDPVGVILHYGPPVEANPL